MNILDVPCPACQAAAGEFCVGRIGTARGVARSPHADRIWVVRSADGAK